MIHLVEVGRHIVERAAERVETLAGSISSYEPPNLPLDILAFHREKPAVILIPPERVHLQLVQPSRRPIEKATLFDDLLEKQRIRPIDDGEVDFAIRTSA